VLRIFMSFGGDGSPQPRVGSVLRRVCYSETTETEVDGNYPEKTHKFVLFYLIRHKIEDVLTVLLQKESKKNSSLKDGKVCKLNTIRTCTI
jgi:hypothetical protein